MAQVAKKTIVGKGTESQQFPLIFNIFNSDGFVKSPKRANFEISHFIISIGYEI